MFGSHRDALIKIIIKVITGNFFIFGFVIFSPNFKKYSHYNDRIFFWVCSFVNGGLLLQRSIVARVGPMVL